MGGLGIINLGPSLYALCIVQTLFLKFVQREGPSRILVDLHYWGKLRRGMLVK